VTVTLNKDGSLRNGGKLRADYIDDVERAWFPALDDLGPQGLRDYLVTVGKLRAPLGSAITLFIADHRDLRPDHLSNSSRWTYRRQLESLDPPPTSLRRTIPG
jgi:hypothetical protein